jgi:hypothetical protein
MYGSIFTLRGPTMKTSSLATKAIRVVLVAFIVIVVIPALLTAILDVSASRNAPTHFTMVHEQR